MKQGKTGCFFTKIGYRIVITAIDILFPKTKVEGTEHLPEGACVVVGNHAQMAGPIVSQLYFPGRRLIWCAWQMMYLKEVPAYAYEDFWSSKPKWSKWFYKILSYVMAPFSVCLFRHAKTIPVYHDSRILTTFRLTCEALENDTRVIIFPECREKHNHIVNRFQDKFIEIARLYHKKTGKDLSFVPIYFAPAFKKAYLGEPIVYRFGEPAEAERKRVCEYLMDAVTKLAEELPEHTVVPYENVSKKMYGKNRRQESDRTENGKAADGQESDRTENGKAADRQEMTKEHNDEEKAEN